MNLSNIKIFPKIVFCFALLAITVGFTNWSGMRNAGHLQELTTGILESEVVALTENIRANVAVVAFAKLANRYFIAATERSERPSTQKFPPTRRSSMN